MKVKEKIPLKIRAEDTRMMPMNSVGIYRMKLVSTHGGIVPCTLKAISGKPKYRLSSHTGIYSIDDKTSRNGVATLYSRSYEYKCSKYEEVYKKKLDGTFIIRDNSFHSINDY